MKKIHSSELISEINAGHINNHDDIIEEFRWYPTCSETGMNKNIDDKRTGRTGISILRGISCERGFSLIELLVAITLIMIVSLIAFMNSDIIKNQRLKSATQELMGNIRKMQGDAQTKSSDQYTRGFGVRFSSGSQYHIFEFRDADGDFTYDGLTEENNRETINLPNGVSMFRASGGALTAPNGSASDIRIYDKKGIMRSTTWSSASGLTIVVKYEGVTTIRCISFNIVRVREGIWDGANCRDY